MSGGIRVVIVDDHAIVREGLRTVLAPEEGFVLAGEAASVAEATALVDRSDPDVVVLDLTLPDGSGLEVARKVKAGGDRPRVLILSVNDRTEYVLEAVRAGADGYLLKDSSPGELRDAIRAVHEGAGYFSPSVAQRLSAGLRAEASDADEAVRLETLTPREREVLRLVAQGRTNREAAAELGISHRTVETHRESLMKKLGLHTVADLTRIALRHKLLDDARP